MDGSNFDDLTRALASGVSRRRLVGAVVGALAAARAAGRAGAAGEKVPICHLTNSATNPVVLINVSVDAVPAHEAHGDVIAPDFANDPNNCGGCLIRCDDGDPCTVDSCAGGQCVHSPKDCSALDDQCNSGVCRASDGACVKEPRAAGASCDDGDACTQTDACDGAGTCVGSDPVVCAALDACHDAGTCDPATGACSNPPKPNGTRCGNDNACDGTETCQAGVCDPPTGECSNPARTDGAPCETGNACTADTCQEGVCQEGPVNVACPDPTECQQSVACNPATGTCDLIVNQPAGFACGAPASCAGGVAHVADTCDADGSCVAGTDTPCGPGEDCAGTTCAPVACLAVRAACEPGGGAFDNRCCQDEPTFCEDVSGCGGETQSQCCHVGGGSCADSCDCCDLDVCEGNRCCHPSGTACDVFEVNACCGQNVCDSGQCCRPEGAWCSFFEVDDYCPGFECDGQFCSCRPPGEPCTQERDVCCIGLSEGGQCAALDGSFPSDDMVCCLFRGESCTSDSQCCQSEQPGIDIGCRAGRCCSGPGDGCLRNDQCCSGACCIEPNCGTFLFGECL